MAVGLQGTCAMLLALGAGNGLNASIGIPHAEFRRTYSLCPNGRIVIENLYGDVRITAWDRDEVLVEAIKRSPDARRLDDARIVVDSSAGLLSIPALLQQNPNAVPPLMQAYAHSAALDSGGAAWAWGNDIYGQLGDGSNSSRSTPVRSNLPATATTTGISAGDGHTVALGSVP